MARSYLLLVATFLVIAAKYHVKSLSPSNNRAPSASPSMLPSSTASRGANDVVGNENGSADDAASSSAATASNEESPASKKSNPSSPSSSRQPKSSSVTFLYELYEHEIYEPKTDGWSSRRFTQSPVAGGGGRDSTSLDPQSCAPPRNYLFDGEWKIDMTGSAGRDDQVRDGFGWEYYVGRYDGLGRRRRRWVRNLRRVATPDIAVAAKLHAMQKSKEKLSSKETTKKNNNGPSSRRSDLLKATRDQYSFKGFGWSLYKSLVRADAVGASFRVPLSANFDSYDKFLAAPYVSSAVYFGYPWVIANFWSASVPLEAVRWAMGAVGWKVRWGLAVTSAFVRGFVEAVIWVILGPWRVWSSSLRLMTILANRFWSKNKPEEEIIHASEAEVDATIRNITDSIEGTAAVSIETHIELNNSSEYGGNGDMPEMVPVTTAVVDSPRGGASSNATALVAPLSLGKRHITVSGNEVPAFRYPKSVEYSSTCQERIGVTVSWRVSRERGYEYRCHLVYTCLPTLFFWRRLEGEWKRRVEAALGHYTGIWGVKRRNAPSSSAKHNEEKSIEGSEGADGKDAVIVRSQSTSPSWSGSNNQLTILPLLRSFLSDHSSTLGISGGWPMPFHPYFSFNLMLSLSGFYYGWLVRYVRALFVLPSPTDRLTSLGSGQRKDVTKITSAEKNDGGEKLVSSALKNKKLSLDKQDAEDDLMGALEDVTSSMVTRNFSGT
eukprot:CAMPEP_0172554992 /NCGR_PEP_ID=MMETSP1067-20121228/57459_1 /TAXON_ID=265564 ORGANISM="Thalassiosira punctigera, Strain Tpunct2005C2" /NCGR_SAMPLE_ID=MMETSP1067 /ASSEMBLY_ACC=CAM_ASM_000444 /LENGTH=719 /DNA_ID=CAMNT_0013343483 /DNA_START=261 /DNA_END=2421 /DNA_ORIENTATION=+